MSKASEKEAERQESIAWLRERIKPGDTIYTVIRKVSRSGMSRVISLYIIDKDGDPMPINYHAALAVGYTMVRGYHDGLRVNGCGMDMCFATVYNLGRTLFPKGGPLKNSDRAHQEKRAGKRKETDGGYLLRYKDL